MKKYSLALIMVISSLSAMDEKSAEKSNKTSALESSVSLPSLQTRLNELNVNTLFDKLQCSELNGGITTPDSDEEPRSITEIVDELATKLVGCVETVTNVYKERQSDKSMRSYRKMQLQEQDHEALIKLFKELAYKDDIRASIKLGDASMEIDRK